MVLIKAMNIKFFTTNCTEYWVCLVKYNKISLSRLNVAHLIILLGQQYLDV